VHHPSTSWPGLSRLVPAIPRRRCKQLLKLVMTSGRGCPAQGRARRARVAKCGALQPNSFPRTAPRSCAKARCCSLQTSRTVRLAPLNHSGAPSVEAAATADVATAPVLSPGREETISPAALQSWQRELIAQIERHKSFPASARGRSGVATVAFSIDRSGRLTSVRIFASSGSAAFDEAALDLIRRSQPFSTPPAALRESDLSFIAPVRYLPSAAR
jgi:TonB family protein